MDCRSASVDLHLLSACRTWGIKTWPICTNVSSLSLSAFQHLDYGHTGKNISAYSYCSASVAQWIRQMVNKESRPRISSQRRKIVPHVGQTGDVIREPADRWLFEVCVYVANCSHTSHLLFIYSPEKYTKNLKEPLSTTFLFRKAPSNFWM